MPADARILLHLSTVEVWQIELEQESGFLAGLLTREEHTRAARLKRPGRSERWIVTRAALRILLGARLGCVPEDVTILVDEHGKPYVLDDHLRFNLTHSGDRALIALAHDLEVGVDVERPGRTAAAVERTLSAGERATGDDLLQIWCRKEALAKAMGGGLAWAPENFDTTRPKGYTLADIALGDGYLGALAVQGERADYRLSTLSL